MKKIDKLEFSNIKNFFSSNYTIKKVKRQPAEWVKIFPNHKSDKNT